MDLLTKHFGELLSTEPPDFNGSKEHEEAARKSLTKLICDNNLESNEKDLFQIICYFSWAWSMMVFELACPNFDLNFYKDCKTLLSILKKEVNSSIDISRIEFGDKAGQGIITSSNLFYIILRHLDIPALTEQLEGHFNDKDFFTTEPRKLNNIKKSFIKSCLLPLFEYLKNETNLKTESNNTIYEFIKDFCSIGGVEWERLSTQDDSANYLKKTFSLIRNDK